eukprot:TRINITY_DN8228_c0_g3_i1.p1 TRINITY_DN8228_c0_g3~~TRINITY_DN8228_c0_g3_i1.p1  ORF type:complete len:395 (+),score=65.29 TRINITY_DN8228_c0_g3_i1:61-1245(+)
MAESQPLEKGTIVASRSDPDAAIGYVTNLLEGDNVELVLYKGGMLVECPADDVTPSPQWYIANQWKLSKDKACNVRVQPTMDSEKIGTRIDDDKEVITHEISGFLRIQNIGWVRKEGNFTGTWERCKPAGESESRSSTPPPMIASPTPSNGGSEKFVNKGERELAVAEKARLMKKAFLEGVSVDEALERVAQHVNSPTSGLLSMSPTTDNTKASSIDQYEGNVYSIPSSLRTPSSVSSPTASPNSRGAARVRITEPTDHVIVSSSYSSPGPTPGWVSASYVTHTPKRSGSKGKSKKPGPVLPPPPPPPSPKFPLDPLLQEWLVQYNLTPYNHIFSQHEVDIVVLPTLTYADFVEMRLPPNVCRAVLHAVRHPDDKPLLERPRQRSPSRKGRSSR